MSEAPRRWIRLDVGWNESDWLAELSVGARLAWVLLLGAVKRDGVGGQLKTPTTKWAARTWAIPESDVAEMLAAASKHGALGVEGGAWTVFGWEKYQKPDRTAADRMRRLRRNGAGYGEQGVTRHATPTQTLTQTKPKEKRARGTALPDDWTPNDAHRAIGKERGVNVDEEAVTMRDWALAGGEVKKDWDATFRNWLRRAKAMTKGPRSFQDAKEEGERQAHRAWVAQHPPMVPVITERKAKPATTPDSGSRGNIAISLPESTGRDVA